jgi:hypothetical protein
MCDLAERLTGRDVGFTVSLEPGTIILPPPPPAPDSAPPIVALAGPPPRFAVDSGCSKDGGGGVH